MCVLFINLILNFSSPAVFSQVYSPVDKGVYLYNVGYCAFLCVRTSGQLYSRVRHQAGLFKHQHFILTL